MTTTDVSVGAAVTTERRRRPLVPALVVTALGLGVAALAHRLVPQVGILTWAVAVGVVAANLNLLPARSKPALGYLTKKLLRAGVMLLGCSITLGSIAALGAPVIAIVAAVLVSTLLGTVWLGRRMRLGGPRSLLIGAGVAICGASAIAAMEETAGGDEEDATAAIAMVTLLGTVAMLALPLLRSPLNLTDLQYSVWSGASVHEVGQVVATASPAGAAVVATAVIVKLTRVLLLAPVVAAVGVIRRSTSPRVHRGAGRPPLVPLFVLGFLACAVLRSAGVIPEAALTWIETVQVAALGAALFGMGASVHIASLVKKSGALLAVATISTLFITGVALAAVLALVQ